MNGRLRDLLLASLAGLAVAWVGVVGYGVVSDLRSPALPEVGDRVQQAADALRGGDHVYVAPDAHDRVTPAGERTLEQLAESSRHPVYVVVWEGTGQAGYQFPTDAASQLIRVVDREGVYVLWDGVGQGVVSEHLEGYLAPSPVRDFYGDPLLRLSEVIESVDAAAVVPASGGDYWGGPVGATAAGLVFATGGIPVALLLLGLGRLLAGRRFFMPGGWW